MEVYSVKKISNLLLKDCSLRFVYNAIYLKQFSHGQAYFILRYFYDIDDTLICPNIDFTWKIQSYKKRYSDFSERVMALAKDIQRSNCQKYDQIVQDKEK